MTTSPTSESATKQSPDRWLGALLCCVFAISLLSAPALRYDGDANAWEMEAESLVHRGQLAVRTSVAESLPPGAPYLVFNASSGQWYSKYGIGNTLIYAIPLAFERYVLGIEELAPPSEVFGKTAGAYEVTRRLWLFNGFNLILTMLLASVLYRLALLYTPHASTSFFFTLACLYTTYLWNYTRAHSSQIYQVLFFTLAAYYLARFARAHKENSSPATSTRHFLGCVLSLCALCSVKLVFLPLIALLGVAFVLAGWDRATHPITYAVANLQRNARLYALCGVIPLLLLGALLLWVNAIKFDSPFNMGYERETHLFGGKLIKSIPAYLFQARYSIFIHFPLLIVAAFGLPAFARKHRYDFATSWVAFLTMFGIYSSYTYWTAEASYGPRYLLFALPVLSLPMVTVLDHLRGAQGALRRIVPGVLLIALLGTSTYAQVLVNSLEFHTFFRLRQQFQLMDRRTPELQDYLRKTNTALFNRDFIRYRDTGVLPVPLEGFKAKLAPARFSNMETSVHTHLKSNHYFW